MHSSYISVNSVNDNGIRGTMVPRPSLETRKNYQNAWFFRLAAEMQDCAAKGWKIGFFTLTYSDENLPYLPSTCFNKFCKNFKPVPCFDKSQVRKFIISLRKWFFDKHNVTGCKYLIASELGEHTRRPHYHGLIAWPAEVSANDVHSAILEKWEYGFVFPRSPLGGRDSHGYNHKPFELESDPIAAARYAAKYVCKDFVWLDSIKDIKALDIKHPDFRNAQCFHIQSKSLGLSLLAKSTDEQKLKWLTRGYEMVGQDKLIELPIYLKNKILFNPYYIVDEQGNRLVRRKRTEFFKENYKAIYEAKCAQMEKLFTQMRDVNWWYNSCTNKYGFEDLEKALSGAHLGLSAYERFLDKWSFTPASFSRMYVARFGLHPDNCANCDFALQWYARYCEDNILAGLPRCDYDSQTEFNNDVIRILEQTRLFDDSLEKETIRFNNEISDFHKSTA